jgi:hypothetical protein
MEMSIAIEPFGGGGVVCASGGWLLQQWINNTR